jgi:glycosyltransferase 2 family protein
MTKKKSIINILFLIVVLVITIFYIFHDEDLGQIVKYIGNADMRYWIAAIGCVIVFISSEAIVIFYLMRTLSQKVRFDHCMLYSFIGFFFSCITPSASGGQPAQIYYMRKDKIPVATSTVVLIIVTIAYKLILVAIGVTVLIAQPKEIMEYLNPVVGICYLGLGLNIICVWFMVMLVWKPGLAHKFLNQIIMILCKLHILRRKEHYLEKANHSMDQYKDVADYLANHKMVMVNVLLITIVQRFFLFFVGYLAYRSFGLHEAGLIQIVILQGMISVAVDMLPLPGGVGITEKLFILIFTPLIGGITLPVMVVSRGLSYYTELVLSALMTGVAHFTLGRERHGRKRIR